MFELMHLRCFVAVAEELHFGRAAARLNMTQPPLSRQIQILERVLGVELLKRSSRSVELTPAGRAFLVEARRIVRLAENAAVMTRRAASGALGSLTLGFTAASGYSYVPELIRQLRATLADVDLNLKEMVTVDQSEALLNRRIDLGLLRPPVRHAELESLLVLKERLFIAAPSGGIEGRAAPTALAGFDDLPMIMFSPDGARYFFDLIAGLLAIHGVAPRYVQYVTQIHSILALVRAGLGAALVPEAACALHFEGVELTPLDEGGLPVELLLVWRKDNPNPVLERAIDLLRRTASPTVDHAG